MQVDSFTPAHSAFGFPIYVAPLPAGSIQRVCHNALPWLISFSLVPCCLKTKSTKKGPHNEPRYFEHALSNTSSFSHHCLFSIDVSWLYAHGGQILCGRPRDAKAKFDRLVESPVIKDDDWINATSITIDSVEPLPLSDGKADVSFVVRWTTGVGDARTDHSGNWQANLQKAKDGHCHVMGVAVRSGDTWLKAINTDFEIK